MFTQSDSSQSITSTISFSALINLIYMYTAVSQTFSIVIFSDNIIMMENVERK